MNLTHITAKEYDEIINEDKAVSYTHLDVYKRQKHYCINGFYAIFC